MRSNRLLLNMKKILWCASSRRQHQIPDEPLRVDSDLVQLVRSVRNLDSDLSMNTHITRTVYCSFAVLRQIRNISRSVSQPVVQSLIVSLVISRNESRFGSRFWRTPVRMDLHHSTMLMTFTRWRRSSHATAAFNGDCCIDRPSHDAFYDRRSRFLCLCRSGMEQPSTLGYVISVPSGFPEASEDSFIYSFLPVVATLFYVLYCRLVSFCSCMCFSIVRFSL